MNAPDPITVAEEQTFEVVPLADLHPSPTNPRHSFPADKLAEMAESIRQHGVLQPILVRPWPDHYERQDGHAARFEIIAGERRYRASGLADKPDAPVMIRHLDDNAVLEFQVIENLQREDVHPLEEAEGYQLLMQRTGCSADDLAGKVGKSKAYIYARLKLTAIQGKARQAFIEDRISASIALLIARIPVAKLQDKACEEVADGWSGPMSARRASEHIQNRYMLRLADAPFPRGDGDLVKGAPTCHKCPSRTGNQPELFADVKSADVCTDPDCFAGKTEAHKRRQMAEAKADGKKVFTGKEAKKIAPYGTQYSELKEGWTPLDRKVYDAPTDKKGNHPTWRQLIGDDIEATALVEDGNKLIEIAQVDALVAAAKAKGIDLQKSSQSNTGNDEAREREKKAKAETAWRTLLLQRILDKQAGARLEHADLVDVAKALWQRLGHDTSKRLTKLWLGRDKREDIDELEDAINTMTPQGLNKMLLAMAFIDEAHVSTWQTIATPERLIDAAADLDIDVKAVQAEASKPPEKAAKAAKAQPVSAVSDPGSPQVGDRVRIKSNVRGTNGIKRKCCGREGVIEDQQGDGAYYSVRFGPKAHEIVTGLVFNEFDVIAAKAEVTEAPATQKAGHPQVKYRHPDNHSMTWTGRGKKPRWVQDWLDGGKTLEELEARA